MNMQDFAYWLQGFFEISESNSLTPKQVAIIKEHLDMVFKHVVGAPVAHTKPALSGSSQSQQGIAFPPPQTTYC